LGEGKGRDDGMKTRLTGFLFGKRKKKERGVAARFGSRPLAGIGFGSSFFFLN